MCVRTTPHARLGFGALQATGMGKKTARGRGHEGGRKPPKGARRFKGGRVAPRAEQLHFPDDVQAVVCELLCDLRLPCLLYTSPSPRDA